MALRESSADSDVYLSSDGNDSYSPIRFNWLWKWYKLPVIGLDGEPHIEPE
jgi:hypothetical protein